jgi:RHS repeat-associated protein
VGVVSESLTVGGFTVPLISGSGNWTAPLSAGFREVVASATDAAGNTGYAYGSILVDDNSDTVPPEPDVDPALDGATITAATDIIGTVDDDSGEVIYSLALSPPGQDQWTTFADGAGPIVDGVLGTLDPSLQLDGWHDLRLRSMDVGGNVVEVIVPILIDAPAKVGNMTVEFTDLEIPLSGLPIKVKRVYDSRLRGQVGDFGNGWKLDTKNVRITKNRPEGEGWNQQLIFLLFTWFYQLFPTESHQVYVDFGAGRVREFNFSVSPTLSAYVPWQYTGPGTSPIWDESSGTGTYMTGGVGQPAACVLNGTELLGGATLQLYDLDTYQLILEDGTYLHISVDDGILELQEPNGNQLSFTDTGMIHSGGASVLYTRDALGRITAISDPTGGVVTYSYDDAGNLVAVTDRDGQTSTMTYTADHFLQDVHDPTGARLIRNYYDDQGRLIQQCDGLGQCVDVSFDPASGQELRYDRNGYAHLTTYDGDGHAIEETDGLGRTRSYTWDGEGNLLAESSPAGATQTHTYSGHLRTSTTDYNGCTESFTYDTAGRVVERVDKMGVPSSTTYDGNGNLTSETDREGWTKNYSYDSSGHLIQFSDRSGATWTYGYDANGWKTSETDPEGNTKTWTYDGLGRRVTESTADGTTSFAYDGEGNVVQSTRPDGGVETWTYDAAGRETSHSDALGRTTSYVYDYNGNRVRTVFPDGTFVEDEFDGEDQKVASTDELGQTTTYVLDGGGQSTQIIRPDGGITLRSFDVDGNLVAIEDNYANQTSNSHDAMGNRLSQTDPLGNTVAWTYDCNGRVSSNTDPNGTVTVYEYDAEGRRTSITRGLGSPAEATETTEYDPEGRVTGKTLPGGAVWQYAYDGNGQLVQVTDPAGAVTAYERDGAGRVLVETDALGRETTYSYDAMGRKLSETSPGGRTSSWTYDLSGRNTSRTDPDGGVTTFAYDDRDRLVETLFADGSVETTSYDARGSKLSVDLDGELTTWEYDEGGRVTSQTNPDGSQVSYSYDLSGRLLTVSGSSGSASHSLDRSYDAAGRLASVSDSAGRSATYIYDPSGNRVGESRSNGGSAIWTYDALNRLTSVEHRDSGGLAVARFEYSLDVAGRRVHGEELDGSTVDWSYDSAGRLVSETRTGSGARTASWVYDAVGNRLEEWLSGTPSVWLYDDDDRLLDDGTRTYSWDDLGRLVATDDGSDVDSYAYDPRGRLLEVQRNGSPLVTYEYDAGGNRISRDDGFGIRRYLVDPQPELAMVLLETDELGNPLATYSYGDDLFVQERGGERWYMQDGLGSVRALADPLGSQTDSYTYGSWGESLAESGFSTNDYRYSGEQHDPATGWYYLRARYMDPATGRFATPDPWEGALSDPRTLHRYTYTPDDPVNYADPSGQTWAGALGWLVAHSISLTPHAFAMRFIFNFVVWSIKALIMTTYVIAPGTQLMQLGQNLGGPLGAAVTQAGLCLIQWGVKFLMVHFVYAFVFSLVPILGNLMMVMNLIRFKDQILFMIRHARQIPDAARVLLRLEGRWRNLPSDIPQGSRLSQCVEAQSGVSAGRMNAAISRFKRDHASGKSIQPSMQDMMDLMIPIYLAIEACAAQLEAEAAQHGAPP